MTLYLNQLADLAVIGAVLYLAWLLRANVKATRAMLERLDEYPRSVLKDLQKKARKNEKTAVKYRDESGTLRTAKEMVTGELDK